MESSLDDDSASQCLFMTRSGVSLNKTIGPTGLRRVLGRLDFDIFGGVGLGILRYEFSIIHFDRNDAEYSYSLLRFQVHCCSYCCAGSFVFPVQETM